MIQNTFHSVLSVRHLTPATYVLRFERKGLIFRPGQHIFLGIEDYPYMREYSVYSGSDEAYLEVLIKEVDGGDLSIKFKACTAGSKIRVKQPQGSFMDNVDDTRQIIFIATGTGISPFHSYVVSYPQKKAKLIHGVRTKDEAYDHDAFKNCQTILCTSKDTNADYHGRVSSYLKETDIDKKALYFLCGNGNMIYEVFDILQKQGVDHFNINYEIYF